MQNQCPLQIRGRLLVPGSGPFILGVLNVTPDSFSDGGSYTDSSRAVAAGLRMAEEGADVIDVGGESTRPGSLPVPPAEQIRRVEPVIAELSRRFGPNGPCISVDTRSAEVALAALAAGATVINDVSAGRDDEAMFATAARHGAGLVLMHMKGTPADMQIDPYYEDLMSEIMTFLAERMRAAAAAGVNPERIIVDPGLGFGKTIEHNLTLLRRADEFRKLGVPVLIGPSRKGFIARVTDAPEVPDRLAGTLAAVSACVLAGVECVRVHDVAAACRAAKLCAAIRNAP